LIFNRYISKKYNKIQENAVQEIESGKKANFWRTLLATLPDASGLVQELSRAHFAIFFIQGFYMQFSRRFAGIKQVYTKKP